MSRQKQKFNIVSLGCARNLVDSEVMAGLLQKNDYQIAQQPEDADIVLVNTCGFIGPAKEESIETILEVSRLKEEGKVKKLVVAGCLSQRYPDELARELPLGKAYTCWPVITVAAYLLRRYRQLRDALFESVSAGEFQLLQIDGNELTAIHGILSTYNDQNIDLADATLVQLADREQIAASNPERPDDVIAVLKHI